VSSLGQIWRTSTVRLTALFILIFVVFAVVLLAFITWQSSLTIQRQQADAIDRDVLLLQRTASRQGLRGLAFAVDRLSRQPGPGIYYLGDDAGLMVVGNATDMPLNVLAEAGLYSFDYERERPFDNEGAAEQKARAGFAVVRSVVFESGLRLVVGRDVAERRDFTAVIFQGFFVGVLGILFASVIAGLFTAMRVLRRIETITATSTKIMSGSLSERIPVTSRNDEFDSLATNLNAMLDRIEQLMVGLKEVTDNVAHDLKTPLTRLRNKAESALRASSDATTHREALETTIAESDQLIRTFNALLMIARAEAGTPSGAFTAIDISAVAADVAELYQPVAEEAGVTLVTEINEGLQLSGNRELLAQALVNLVENAIKYGRSPDGTPARIVIRVSGHAGRVKLEVDDNGPGIAPEDRGRAVERFVRLEKSRTEPGSGLGLSLVAAVARLHRGEFRLEDAMPGLRAVIELPQA